MGVSAAATTARIGVYGGAFDPPHNAHMALAVAAVTQLRLTELRIFPTGEAWHKARALSAAADRLAMVKLAFADVPGARVDDRELKRTGPSYTLDTLRELRAENPDAQLLLVLGADQGQALPQWHGWQEILSIAIVCIAYRASPSGSAGQFDPQSLPDVPSGARFETIEFMPMTLSATEIRERIRRGEDVSRLVPPAVARYIAQHHLYTRPDDN